MTLPITAYIEKLKMVKQKKLVVSPSPSLLRRKKSDKEGSQDCPEFYQTF
jgi:hypothetical protein